MHIAVFCGSSMPHNNNKKKSETRGPRFSVVSVSHYYISESFL